MKKLNNIKNILWDFDGVLMDSMPIRNKGFEIVLKDFPDNEVNQLMSFHLKNGGLSRYVKFRYFFEEIRKRSVTDKEIEQWAEKFSEVMKLELTDNSLLIEDTTRFVRNNSDKFEMHIVSGSDQNELRYLCESLGINKSFITINGSPTPKKELVNNLIKEYHYDPSQTVLIGDSINDYQAAKHNEIWFSAYNNSKLDKYSDLSFPKDFY